MISNTMMQTKLTLKYLYEKDINTLNCFMIQEIRRQLGDFDFGTEPAGLN